MDRHPLREPRTLDELLNYRLARLVTAGGAPVVRLLEGRYGIARREWGLLALLADAGPLSPSALALRAQLDRPRTSRAISSLVAKGLVARAPQVGDARRAQVLLTDEGGRLVKTVFPQIASINARLVEVLGEAELEVLDRVLERLTEQALRLNRELVQDVRANRRAGGGRRPRAGEPPP